MVRLCTVLCWGLFLTVSAGADVKLPAVISDNMVLQQKTKAAIWGWADPGEVVTVILGSKKAATRTEGSGRWMVKLETPAAGGPFELTISGKNSITLKNVLIGEVWLGSGQSNMEWPVTRAANPEAEIAAATHPSIRLFTVQKAVAGEPLTDCTGKWVECSPQTIRSFSAVAYYFGRHLHQTLNVPVGLIHSSWGGTPAEAWTSLSSLQAVADAKPLLERWEHDLANYPTARAEFDKKLAEWQAAADRARAEGKQPQPRPQPPPGPSHPWRPAGLFNAMIAPLKPFAINGVIWYQGESNASRAYQYRSLFQALIKDWRRAWAQGDLAFLFVQLANFNPNHPDHEDSTGESDWAELREAQTMALSLPRTGQAVTIDIGDPKDIHPTNKQEVGRRLALAALHIAYGRKLAYSGPRYLRMQVERSAVRLSFEHSAGGLEIKGGGPLTGFAIAGEDRHFFVAEARIEGDSVVVRSDRVPKPVAVRYAWANNPAGNLINRAGLPASPFRTDDWPGKTVNNR